MLIESAAAATVAASLAVGTFWFWVLAVVVFTAITALVENDNGLWATIVFIATVCLLQYLSKVPILESVKENPWQTLGCVGLYFAIGIGWTLVKWYFYVHRQVVKYNEFKRLFLKANNATELTPALAIQFSDKLEEHARYERGRSATLAVVPDPSEHKGDLIRWGTYWPFSVVGTALNDVVRRAWEYVYEMLQTTYQRMAKAVFRGAVADIEMAKQVRNQQLADATSRRKSN